MWRRTLQPTATLTSTPTPTPQVLPTAGTATPTATTNPPPTALSLIYFNATATANTIVLQWETAVEFDIGSFQLWRSTNGQRSTANLISSRIPSQGTAASGAAYSDVDTDVQLGAQYTYWLQAVGVQGTTDLASASATSVQRIFLPAVNR